MSKRAVCIALRDCSAPLCGVCMCFLFPATVLLLLLLLCAAGAGAGAAAVPLLLLLLTARPFRQQGAPCCHQSAALTRLCSLGPRDREGWTPGSNSSGGSSSRRRGNHERHGAPNGVNDAGDCSSVQGTTSCCSLQTGALAVTVCP
jgi:hypothetical protein